MLVAAAVCPCPPLLVPEVAAGAAAELDALRAACDEALAALVAADPQLVVVVGAGPEAEVWTEGGAGSFQRYGVPLVAKLPGGRIEGRSWRPR